MKNDLLKATPVLTGKDAKRFLENMRKVDAEREANRKRVYLKMETAHVKFDPLTPQGKHNDTP